MQCIIFLGHRGRKATPRPGLLKIRNPPSNNVCATSGSDRCVPPIGYYSRPKLRNVLGDFGSFTLGYVHLASNTLRDVSYAARLYSPSLPSKSTFGLGASKFHTQNCSVENIGREFNIGGLS